MEKFEEKLESLLEKSKKAKIDLSKLKSIKKNRKYFKSSIFNYKIKFLIIFSIFTLIFWNLDKISSKNCLISIPNEIDKIFRYPQNCDFCRGIKSARRISQISPEEFEDKFAYTGEVVIVTDAMTNWTAHDKFDFWYFKNLYETHDPKRKTLDCQFFRYKTNFKNLFDALQMPIERVKYQKGTEPWYFGWSSCNEQIAKKLREHYDRPYFLPKSSELNAIDWIFMGGRGLGAHMHLDNVRLPSWQAQLKGEKEWKLAPPPECLFECHSFSVIVHPGEISMKNLKLNSIIFFDIFQFYTHSRSQH